jgi:hypothetical protein
MDIVAEVTKDLKALNEVGAVSKHILMMNGHCELDMKVMNTLVISGWLLLLCL